MSCTDDTLLFVLHYIVFVICPGVRSCHLFPLHNLSSRLVKEQNLTC